MNSPREIEIKFAAPSESFSLVKRSLPTKFGRGGKSAKLVSVYFDTEKLHLHKHGLSLRVRRNGRHHLQTIKSENGQALARAANGNTRCNPTRQI